MLGRCWRMIKRVVFIVGVALSFLIILEVIRAYETLRDLHAWAGWAFLLVLLVGLIWLSYVVIKGIWLRPPVVKPPKIVDRNHPTPKELQRYQAYLQRYIDRLLANKHISSECKEQAQAKLDALQQADRGQTQDVIREIEEQVIGQLLAELDEEAEKEIRRCVRDVMAAVIFIPYRSVDVAIVLYRNLAMIVRLVKVYNSRPRLRELLIILRDTLKVVALVNYFDLGRSMLEDLGSKVPGIGRFVDDIAEGTGAGFMTSIVGHAAKHRCRAFRGWNEDEAKDSLGRDVVRFYGDVKDMFKKDFLPAIMGRVADKSKETWDKVVGVLDETGSRIGQFVKGAWIRKGQE